MSATQSVAALLKKTEHYDKDERYMATSDLCEFLKRQETLDAKTEKNICQALLNLLHDPSRDVQAVAVKTLGVLLAKVQQEQVLEIADSLTDQVLDARQEELRDVYTIGLKTLVRTMVTTAVANRLLGPGRLLEGIRGDNEDIALACLDILCDLLTCGTVTSQHEAVLNLCLTKLSAQAPVIRKRAGNALACLSTLLTDSLLQRMVDAILQDATANPHTIIRTLCAVAGTVGHRLGQAQMDRILPLFLKFTKPQDAINGDDEDHDDNDETPKELRESCFMGLEAFVQRCPVEVETHLEAVMTAALAYASYDPNYAYGPDDDENEDMDEDDPYEDEDEDAYEDEDDEDEDDESWKVRRSAIRVLKAVIEARKHEPGPLWTHSYSVRGASATVSSILVSRLKEREENCRVGVIECFTQLLDSTTSLGIDVADFETVYTPALVKGSMKILGTKKGNERSKSKMMTLLASLCTSPGGLGDQSSLSAIFQHMSSFLVDKGNGEGSIKALRLDALSLVKSILSSSTRNPEKIRSSFHSILFPQLCHSVEDQWYKAQAEALRALALVPQLYAPECLEIVKAEGTDPKDVATALYTAIEPLLAAHDVDQEIKECALKASAALLNMHQLEPDQSTRVMSLLLERLKNETTRLVAVKTLAAVAGCDLSAIFAESLTVLASFLQLSSRTMQQSSLEALDTLVSSQGPSVVDLDLYSHVLKQLATRITDRDLHLCYLALRATVSTIIACPGIGESVKSQVLTPALSLATSSLMQDNTLDALLNLFEQMVISNAVEFGELLSLLQQKLDDKLSKVGIYNLSKSIAAVTIKAPAESQKRVLDDVFKLLEGFHPGSGNEKQVQLALLITGDVGRSLDMSSNGAGERLKNTYLGFFDSSSDELKNAAAYALGNAAVGSPAVFLQAMVGQLGKEENTQQYLLLSALREFIQSSARCGADISTHLGVITPHLEAKCSSPEEGVRTMVADCYGSLVCVQPDLMLPKLVELQQRHSMITTENGVIGHDDTASRVNANICGTIAIAVKLAIYGKVDQEKLSLHMPTFVDLLQQDEISVRSAALLMIYSAVHHMPQTVANLLRTTIMPQLYSIAELKLERKVDLGPFTHTVDDAMPLRKSTLSIFATCLEDLPSSLDMGELLPLLAKFLGDAEDIQLHAHSVVISLASRQPTYIVSSVDSFVEPLQKTLTKKGGQKTGTELERLNDWIKSALRVVLALKGVEGAMSSKKFTEFVDRVFAESKFTSHLSSLAKE